MLKTNGDRLPVLSVKGRISAPTASYPGKIDQDGRVFVLPGTGGITYNAKIGDPACGWAADHLEPGVSTKGEGRGMGLSIVRQTLAEFGGTIALEDGGETAFTVTVPKGNRL